MIHLLKSRLIRKGLSSTFTALGGLKRIEPDPGQVRVLMYHRVDKVNGYNQLVVTPEAFDQQMDYLANHGYETISLAQLLSARQTQNTLPLRPIIITFDDGFQDVYRNAFPALERRGFKATIFPVSQWVHDRASLGLTNPQQGKFSYLSWEEIGEMAAYGYEIGSHTRTHPLLPTLSSEQAWEEISISKREIEERLCQAVHFFCYPRGAFNEKHIDMVQRAGFKGACSTMPGPNGPTTDPFALKRTEISPRDDIYDFHRKLHGGFDALHRLLIAKTSSV